MAEITLVWVVRAGAKSEANSLFVERSLIAAPWSKLGDLTQYADRAALSSAFCAHYPDIVPGAGIGYASQLYRFARDIKHGDFVLYPVKQSTSIFVGVVVSDYRFEPNSYPDWPHRRCVQWKSEIDKSTLSKELLQRIGAPAQLSQARLRPHELQELGLLSTPQ